MVGRKEDRERLRQARVEAERHAAGARRRREIVGYAIAALVGAAVLAGGVAVILSGEEGGADAVAEDAPNAQIKTDLGVADAEPDNREGTTPPSLAQGDLDKAVAAAGCELKLNLRDEGSEHATEEDGLAKYGTSPPTSGDHYGSNETGSGAAADGAYSEAPPTGRVLHALEHSRVAIQYGPELGEAEQLVLKGVFDESPFGVLLFPNAEMPYEVAATAWTRLLGCKRYAGRSTLDALRVFRDIYRGQGPEAVPYA